MGRTKIEWADKVWNPVTGCNKVSAGCANCYAERMARRFPRVGMGVLSSGVLRQRTATDFRVLLHPNRLDEPLHWRKGRRVFVGSMTDPFHEDVPDRFIASMFGVMAARPQHTFMMLTKRPERIEPWIEWVVYNATFHDDDPERECLNLASDALGGHWISAEAAKAIEPGLRWPLPNAWLGVSVEDQKAADERIPLLLQTPAAKRFVSVEPMLGPVDLSLWTTNPRNQAREINRSIDYALAMGGCEPDDDFGPSLPDPMLDWVICGGESGPGARPMHPDWPRSLRDQCQAAGVPFFFKQWGEWAPFRIEAQRRRVHYLRRNGNHAVGVTEDGDVCMQRVGKKAAGRLLDGREWNEWPDSPEVQ